MKLFFEIFGGIVGYIVCGGLSFRILYKNPQIRQVSGGYGLRYKAMTLQFIWDREESAYSWVEVYQAAWWCVIWPLLWVAVVVYGLIRGTYLSVKAIGQLFIHPELKPKKFIPAGAVTAAENSPFNLADHYLEDAVKEVNKIAPE